MAPWLSSWNREENQRDGPVAVTSFPLPLQIFGFLASFLCLAGLWLSYKITCINQSSGKLESSESRAAEVGDLLLVQQQEPEWRAQKEEGWDLRTLPSYPSLNTQGDTLGYSV